jgi:hypothetical protein
MHVTSLEIVLAVVAVFVIFGPKKLPGRSSSPAPIKVQQVERVPLTPRMPSQYAAGRAPSPLKLRAAERPFTMTEQKKRQFAPDNSEGSPLPHELLRV